MFIIDGVKSKGRFEIRTFNKDGSPKKQFREYWWAQWLRKRGLALRNIMYLTGYMSEVVKVNNLTTNAGKAAYAARIGADAVEAAFDYLELGTGTTAADATDTELETPITDSGLGRAQAEDSRETTTVANDTVVLTKTWNVSGDKAITEVGLFNASSAGVMGGRNVFSAINVTDGDQFQMKYKVKLS